MRVFIEFLNSIRANKFVVICCLISFVSARDPKKEEEKIAELYKGKREITWKWEMDPFCESTIINKELPGSSWKAYIDDVSLVLPLADCNVVQMEILTCLHQFTNEQGTLGWNAESYVYNHMDEKIYTFDLKRNKEQCNGAPVDIIEYKKEISLGYELIPIKYSADHYDLQKERDWKEEEEQIVESKLGRVKWLWTWEMKSFCESTTINKQFPGSLWSAYVVNVNVVLPSSNCNVAQVETLTCVHRYTHEQGILVWDEESYVGNQVDGQIYTFNLRRNKDECNGIPLNLIDYKERISSADRLDPIKTHVDYGQLPFIDPRRLVDDFEQKLADFYEVNNVAVEWKWETQQFCGAQSRGEFFLRANITEGEIVLPSADCALVEMEILNCEYEVKSEDGRKKWYKKFFVNGRNHDIFTVDSIVKHSKCGEGRYPEYNNYWATKFRIVGGERRPITTRSRKVTMNFQTKPKLLVLGGPSGSGKSTVLRKLFSEFPDQFGFSVSYTTRAPRPGEIEGVHYYYTTRDKLEKMIENGEILESEIFANNLYGTSKAAIEKVLSEGKICVLDIGIEGVRQLKSKPNLESAAYVFIKPPSLEVLEKRLRGRQTDSEESIQWRLKSAERESKFANDEDNFDFVFVHDDFERGHRQFRDFIVETFFKKTYSHK